MHFCTCQQPFMNGGMMMPQQGMAGFQPMSETSPMAMTPTAVQGAGQMGMMDQMGMMNQAENQLPMEQSFIENILRLNRGKTATVYMTFEGEGSDAQREFRGVIEAAGRDHIILSDPQTGERYLLLMVYLNYVRFDEEIEYSYPVGQLATYSPR